MISVSDMILRTAQLNRNSTAVFDNDLKCTWGEFVDRVARIADGLSRLGVEKGDKIAMLAHNSGRYFEYFFSTPWAGCAYVPINTRLALPEIIFWLEDSQSTVLYLGDEFLPLLPQIRELAPQVKHYIYAGTGSAPEGLIDYDDLLNGTQSIAAKCLGGDEVLGIFYTGGTTGRSKGVMLSHDNMCYNALQAQTHYQWKAGETYMHAAPMFHLGDGLHTMVAALVGMRNCSIPSFEPVVFMQTVEEKAVDRCLLVPTMVGMLLNHPDFDQYNLDSLKSVAYGASPMPEAVIKVALTRMPECHFNQVYGQTEAGPMLTFLSHEYHTVDPDNPQFGRLRSAGRAIPGVLIGIFDSTGNPAPQGEVGEIWGRGHNIMHGYNNLPGITDTTLTSGWLHTGDSGYLDAEGFLFLVDRTKDMIISGGENVYSQEVENAIHQYKAVLECAVIGIPDDKWGEQVHAVVRLKADASASEDDIIEHCKSLIANYKCPRSVTITGKPLPLSGAGKILKKDIRAPYWEGRTKQVN
jgi:long-chain acyl-CoA synthetase